MGVERVTNTDVEVADLRRVIVTALPLKENARRKLAELLGARIEDIRAPIEHPDLVLTPACSPQLISRLKKKYSGAQVVVVELDDWDFDIRLDGPVKRILKSGADAYILADSLDELASKISARSPTSGRTEIDQREPSVHELTTGSTVDDVIAAFLRESVEYSCRMKAAEPPGP